MIPQLSEILSNNLWSVIEPNSGVPWVMEQRKEYEMVAEDAVEFLTLSVEDQADKTNLKYLYLHDEAEDEGIDILTLCQTIAFKSEAYHQILRAYRTARRRAIAYLEANPDLVNNPLFEELINDFVVAEMQATLVRYGLA